MKLDWNLVSAVARREFLTTVRRKAFLFMLIGIALITLAVLIPRSWPVPFLVRVIIAILAVVMFLIAIILYVLVL